MLPLLIVDAANVVGSVPDGWWRDRHGATGRLRDALAPLAEAGLPGIIPAPLEVVLVVEGQARRVAEIPSVRVVAAAGSGDDTIVALARDEAQRPQIIVVTADRELRSRLAALDVRAVGPRVLPYPG